MKLARLFLAAVAASTMAACTVDSPTAPTAPPSQNGVENTQCAEKEAQVQADGTIIWICSPSMGSGG
jgi:hypothetical protein